MNWSSYFKNNQTSSFVPLTGKDFQLRTNSLSQRYETPIKEEEDQNQKSGLMTPSPFQLDFNFYFGNLFSSGRIPIPHLEGLTASNHLPQKNTLFNLKKDNSFELSNLKITPNSENKINQRSLNILNINNKNNYEFNSDFKIINDENMTMNSANQCHTNHYINNHINLNSINNNNENNYRCLYKRNLCNMFDKVKNENDKIFLGLKTKKNVSIIIDNNTNVSNVSSSIKDLNNRLIINRNNINNKNNVVINNLTNLNHTNGNSIDNSIVTPKKEFNNLNNEIEDRITSAHSKKNIKIFQCSDSSKVNSTLTKKKKRFRKNQDQIKKLSFFYNENKNWTKNQVKIISEEIGLKENKVYKWLWDQKNKDYKRLKFLVKK